MCLQLDFPFNSYTLCFQKQVRKQATVCSFGSDRDKMEVSFLAFEIILVTSTYGIRGKDSSNNSYQFLKGTSLNSPHPFSLFHEAHVGLEQRLLYLKIGVSIQFLLIFIIWKSQTLISPMLLSWGSVKGCELWEELVLVLPGFVFLEYQQVRSQRT